jgi:hypothetical protein
MQGGSKGSWSSIAVYLYYAIGLLYYIYSWFIIAGGVGVVASIAGIYFSKIDFWWFVFGGVSVLALGLGLAVSFSNWRRRYRGINSGLKILSSHTVYTLMANGQYRYWRELEVVAAIDGVDHFTHIFGWTGRGQILPAAFNGHHPELSDDPMSTKMRLRVYFDRPRAKRERFKIQYQMDMRDTDARARPFLRTNMHEKIRLLRSDVIFDGIECPSKYKRIIYMSDVAEIPVKEEEILVSRDDDTLKWEVIKPRLGYNYCISW